MMKYLNRAALYEAHNIYRDAMREFIIRCLKKVRGERVEDLIRDSLPYKEVEQFKEDLREHNGNIEAAIDIKHFPYIIRKYWHRNRGFSQQFNSNSKIQYKTGTIVEGRNLWAHPGVEDLDPERTRAALTSVAEVLGEIGKTKAKEAVEDIRCRLFSDEPEEHRAEAENADLNQRLAEMSDRLEMMKTEKTEYEEELKRLEEEKTEYAELLDTVEKEKIEIEKQLGTALTALKKQLSETENRPKVIELESGEHIKTLTDKTELEKQYGTTSIKEWRRKIWKQLCDYAAQKDTPVRFNKPGSENYLNVRRSLIDISGFYMKVWLGTDNREIAIRLYMSKQNFYILEKQRKEIEQEFCESLEWEELPQRIDSRISLHKGIIDPTDESDWHNQHEWVISKLEKFHKKFNEVFLPMITMNNPKQLTIAIARELVLQRFQGQTLVRTAEIITHVEKLHCESVRELSENEKMIVSDALSSLRKKGLANNSERRGYWSFHDFDNSIVN